MSSQKEKRVRCKNFTAREEDILLSLVEKFKAIIESKKTDAVSWSQKNEKWGKIQEEFCEKTGTHRTPKMLREKYENMKKKTKVLMAAEKKELYMTGGGPYQSSQQDSITNRLSALMGEGATGLSNDYDGDRLNDTEVLEEEYLVIDESEVSNDNLEEIIDKNNITNENNREVIDDPFDVSDGPESQKNENWSTWNPSALKSKKSSKLCATKKRKASNTGNPNDQVAKAQAVFFQNEEKRAAERHVWEKEACKKRLMWEEELNKKQLELINTKIKKEQRSFEM